MEAPYHLWSKQLERFVMSRLGDPQLAEEIAQESMVRFLMQVQAGVQVKNPRAWLFRTARNLAVDVVRRRLPSPLGLEALAHLPDSRHEGEEGELDTRVGEVARAEVLGWIPELLQGLPPTDREVLLQRYHHGLSCQDLAQLEQISVANAKVRLHRARRRLLGAIEARALDEGGEA